MQAYGQLRSAFAGTPVLGSRQALAPPPAARRAGRAAAAGAPAAAAARRRRRAPPPAASAAAAEPAPAAAQREGQCDWRAHWFPVFFTRDADKKVPHAFTLLGERLVVWWEPAAPGAAAGGGAWRAHADACPHRLAPLSEGRVSPASGRLECPYHGWQFSGCGACTLMPQGGDPADARARVAAFCAAEAQGLVWVKLQPAPPGGAPPDTSDLPLMPEVDDAGWVVSDTFRDLPYDYATLIENVIDSGHVPFTHHGSMSRRQTSGEYELRVVERSAAGFSGRWDLGPRRGALGPQTTAFAAPALMRHTVDAWEKRGFANVTAVYGVPTEPGRCRAIVRQPFRFRSAAPRAVFSIVPRWIGHLSSNDILDDDVSFLHVAERTAAERGIGGGAPLARVYHMPSASDAYVAAFRRWLEDHGGGGPFGPQAAPGWRAAAGPALPLPALLDHYHSHTEKCADCRAALARLRAAKAAARAAAVAAAAVAAAALVAAAVWGGGAAVALPLGLAGGAAPARAVAAAAAAAAAAAGAVWAWCNRTLPRFHRGVWPPPRNTVPGEWAPAL